jgi:predicted nucleotidyltransferase
LHLARLEAAGLVTVRRVGNQKHYQAKRESPIFRDLHLLVIKTVGIVEPLRHALAAYASAIDAAFVYGSSAKGTDLAGSDVDLMVVSDSLAYSDIYAALQPAGQILSRAINPTVLTPTEWRKKRARKGSFTARVAEQPSLFVIGSPRDLD